MGKLIWDATGEHIYETGARNGVLYLFNNEDSVYAPGTVWNGLSSVSESPSGAEANAVYADDMKYLNLYSAEEFAATIEAYTYPDEFAECDGSYEPVPGMSIGQQTRRMFGYSYRTIVGNDVEDNNHGYKIHLLYGCKASPSEKQYQTVNDSPEAIAFSWEINTTPVSFTKADGTVGSTANVTIDTTKYLVGSTSEITKKKANLAALEEILYYAADDPSDTKVATLPLPDEVADILTNGTASDYYKKWSGTTSGSSSSTPVGP